jgi:hypothetical protein
MTWEPNTRTVADEAQECLNVQDGVNVSGIVGSLNRALSTLWNEAHRIGESTTWVNTHPIVALYLHKLTQCCGSDRDYSRDYAEVRMLAGHGEPSLMDTIEPNVS